ncbi:MAG: ferrochelatase [Candidatus Omnitrophica bacterium]|nr:ferrochelatase [Candidatus Omnitrophota bacterium]
MKPKTGVFLINLGTPDSPETPDVRRYLKEFLMDPRVIDIPFWKRFLLIHLIIAPFRSPKSSHEYKKLWTAEGSPLLVYGEKLRDLLQKSLGENFKVVLGMRYQSPSIKTTLKEFEGSGIKQLVVIPLYPQYASASTGSTIEKVLDELKQWETYPRLNVISQFFDHPFFLEAFAQNALKCMEQNNYDHILFSYHGLPERQILKSSSGSCQLNQKCCSMYHAKNIYCYRAQCYQTSRLLAEKINLKESDYTVCFQSRLGRDPWIKPFTDEVISQLAKQGKKKILALSPSFVADCLETTVEIGQTYDELFRKEGGERLDLVESLNVQPQWIECLKSLVLENDSQILN